MDATVGLHEELGPARTTVAAIAKRAGVSRPTVYAQFPDDLSLFSACKARFSELHAFPRIDDLPLEHALARLYAYYAENRRMLAHIDRDARVMPALAEVTRPSDEYLDAVATSQANGLRGARDTRATVRVALDFATWKRLDGEGLSPAEAAALMARLTACAVRR